MESDALLESLLTDLEKVQKVCRESRLEELPEAGIEYLHANRDALRFILDQLYSKTNKSQRIALMERDRRLDSSAAHDEFLEIASHAVEMAVAWQEEGGRGIVEVSEDSLNMLLRALRYARHLPSVSTPFDLARSPIEFHGLKRAFGNFQQVSKEEWESVPWPVSDILYSQRKQEVFDALKGAGLDLKTRKITSLPTKYPQALERWTGDLIELLGYKMECDLAAVIAHSPWQRERFINGVDGKLNHESSLLIEAFRDALQELHEDLQRRPLSHAEGLALEEQLEPFREAVQELRSRVVSPDRPEPRPAIFEAMQKLQGGPKTIVKEIIMGDKNTNYGQAGAVGRNAHVHDVNFTQVWAQKSKDLDLPRLAQELQDLRKQMANKAETAEQYSAISAVASAEEQAKKNQGPGVLEYLSKAGKWALDVATDIGKSVAVEALKSSLGF